MDRIGDRDPGTALAARNRDRTSGRQRLRPEPASMGTPLIDEGAILTGLTEGTLPLYRLEAHLREVAPHLPWESVCLRAAAIRREWLGRQTRLSLAPLASDASGGVERGGAELTRIENQLGWVGIPVGVAGPLVIHLEGEERPLWIPLATNEAALVAGVNRGASLLRRAGGVQCVIQRDGMTRAPVVRGTGPAQLDALTSWLDQPEHLARLRAVTKAGSRFARLLDVEVIRDPKHPDIGYLRFRFFTGDAMGMNMATLAAERAMQVLIEAHPGLELLALSGNLCTDKKQTRINMERGRGLTIQASATIPAAVLPGGRQSAEAVARVNYHKNHRGSELAGTIGGWNAHAANPVAALFAATGQDLAQVVESSMCQTDAEVGPSGALHITCRLPCIEVGTVGGGTETPGAQACLKLLGVAGSGSPAGHHRRWLGVAVAGAVLAGELNLLLALARQELARSHARLTRPTG